ncbi:MAG: LCP family protein [Acidimicrobiia bacterium]|nr:LCP family protein [Acidimicrobiia bacterium]
MSTVERPFGGSISARQRVDGDQQQRAGHGLHDEDRVTDRIPILTADHPSFDRVGQPASRRSRPRRSSRNRRRRITFALLGALALLVAYPAWNAFSIWSDWRNLERQPFDSAAFEQLPEVAPASPSLEGLSEEQALAVSATIAPVGPTRYQTFMIVGMDASKLRADVIVMFMLPNDGSPPVMVSLPRDLYLPNRCTQGLTRINANFNGCGDINGATALSGAIKDFTGYQIDHFALFTFEGFAEIIDQLGGVEICVDHPTREQRRFDIPAGCTLADGELTLGWVRSRKTQEYVDGRWRRVTNVSDLTRNERQQDLILTIFQRAAEFSSPQEMAAVAHSLADAFTLDDQLGIGAAIDLAWNNRGLDPSTIIRPTIPVTDHVTPGGAQVLIPTKSFQEVLDEALGD